MSVKRFFAAFALTAGALIMIFLGWQGARFLYGTNIDGNVLNWLDQVSDEPVNVLCLGLDEDKTRSDVIMLVSLDPELGTVKILSIPRDTRVQINGSTAKINATMGYKNREELLISKIKEITGLPVHYYAEVDFSGFIDIIDILGGVDYNVPYYMDYDDPVQDLHIHFEPGMQHLDGQAAHDYVRFRHNNDGSAPGPYAMGDEGRIQAQQEFLKELFRQKLNPQYITKVPELINAIYEHVTTNFSVADAIKYANVILKNATADSMETFVLPGESKYMDSLWYYVYDPELTQQLVETEFMGLEEEPTGSASPSAGASSGEPARID